MVVCGARTVIGFNDTTLVSDCNKFAPDLTEKLMDDGLTIDDAIEQMNYTTYNANMSNIAVVAGDGNNKLR